MNESFKLKWNPRWENAQYERQFVVHPKDIKVFGLEKSSSGMWAPPVPTRFETVEDANTPGHHGVPPFIKVFPDGREQESF